MDFRDTRDVTINGNLRNAPAETATAARPRPRFPVKFQLQLQLPSSSLVPKWRVDALPNWLDQTHKENGGLENACKRPNYIKSCINHEH
ncbi:hypothetical protein ACLKA7_009962 [Drosophila subpalustris]